jgi:hypothetical protein
MGEAMSVQASVSPMMPGPRELRPHPVRERRTARANLALAHGAFLAATGLWPLLHLRSFARLTAPRPEGWLTRGAGLCCTNLGAALLAAGARGKVAQELRLAAGTTGLTIAALDLHSAARRRSLPQLLNGLAQLAFAAAWTMAELRDRNALRRPPEAAFA